MLFRGDGSWAEQVVEELVVGCAGCPADARLVECLLQLLLDVGGARGARLAALELVEEPLDLGRQRDLRLRDVALTGERSGVRLARGASLTDAAGRLRRRRARLTVGGEVGGSDRGLAGAQPPVRAVLVHLRVRRVPAVG